MSFGPDDKGCWKDKLPYVEHDLDTVRDRERIFRQFGNFAAGFDFGGAVKQERSPAAYRANNYVLQNNVEPRFKPVDANTRYSNETGFGWLSEGNRQEEAIPLTPYLEVRAVAKDPKDLPHDVLFRDYIRGTGAQKFAVRVKDGAYDVSLLHPDHSTSQLKLDAKNGRLEIPMPDGNWSISGIVVKAAESEPAAKLPPEPTRLARPQFRHEMPGFARAGEPLKLLLDVANTGHVTRVRLYYRPLNQLARFKTIEHAPGEAFLIPGEDITAGYDLMYYFEVLDDARGGWFVLDPLQQTPYYVVQTDRNKRQNNARSVY
jgi:hypothetical protein